MRGELARDPSEDELALALEMPLKELRQLVDEVAPYHFVDAADASLSLTANIPDPGRLLERKEVSHRLRQSLEELPEREQLHHEGHEEHEGLRSLIRARTV